MLEFAISSAQVGSDGWIVSVAGELDLYTAPQLERQLASAVEDRRHDVVLDLGATSFVDSTALGVVVAAARRLDALGGSLVLVSDDRRVLRVFEVTGVGSRIAIEPSLSRALDHPVVRR